MATQTPKYVVEVVVDVVVAGDRGIDTAILPSSPLRWSLHQSIALVIRGNYYQWS